MKKLYRKKLMALLVITTITFSCNSDDESILNLISISSISVRDIGDQNNASDLLVNFTLNNVTDLTDLRIVLVKTSEISAFNHEIAQSMAQGNYQSVEFIQDQEEYRVRLEATTKDFKGNDVVNGIDFTVKIVVFNNTEVRILDESKRISLSPIPYLTGKYVGTWDDNLYTAFGISADLQYSSNRLSGPFYYSAIFTACCGGVNDGNIYLQIANDTIIESFTYNQVLITFMNGCNGTYTGTGTIKDFTNLVIDFTGTDCEGPHTGGKIVLHKSE